LIFLENHAGQGFRRGEDPFLGSRQKQWWKDIKVMICQNNTILSCVKHFALYGRQKGTWL
jgi:hypothetical protein